MVKLQTALEARQASKFIAPLARLATRVRFSAEMVYYVYVLYSVELNRYYTGFSQYRGKRKRQHRREKEHWTAGANDWEEVFCTSTETVAEARALEKRIKSRGARRFLLDNAGVA